MTPYRCPKCGHTEHQPAHALDVGHICPKVKRFVFFVRLNDPPKE